MALARRAEIKKEKDQKTMKRMIVNWSNSKRKWLVIVCLRWSTTSPLVGPFSYFHYVLYSVVPDWLYILITVFRNTLAPTRTWSGPAGWWWPPQRSSLGLEEKLSAWEFQVKYILKMAQMARMVVTCCIIDSTWHNLYSRGSLDAAQAGEPTSPAGTRSSYSSPCSSGSLFLKSVR